MFILRPFLSYIVWHFIVFYLYLYVYLFVSLCFIVFYLSYFFVIQQLWLCLWCFPKRFLFCLLSFSVLTFLFTFLSFSIISYFVVLATLSINFLSLLNILSIFTLNYISERLYKGLLYIGSPRLQSLHTRCCGIMCHFTMVPFENQDFFPLCHCQSSPLQVISQSLSTWEIALKPYKHCLGRTQSWHSLEPVWVLQLVGIGRLDSSSYGPCNRLRDIDPFQPCEEVAILILPSYQNLSPTWYHSLWKL